MRSRLVWWGGVVLVIALVVAALLSRPVEEALVGAVTWCRASGPLGVAAFALLYCVVTVAALPASILCVAAGWAWGLVWGTILIQGVSLLADWFPFLLARRAGRARVAAAAARSHTLAALDEVMRRHGFLAVVLLRLSPLAPYNVMNYLLGLTPVRTWTYLIASMVGATPSALLFVYAGTLVERAAGLREPGVADDPRVLAAGLILALAAVLALTILARRALARLVR